MEQYMVEWVSFRNGKGKVHREVFDSLNAAKRQARTVRDEEYKYANTGVDTRTINVFACRAVHDKYGEESTA